MINDVGTEKAGRKGKGVFAKASFKAGKFIFQAKRGKIITTRSTKRLKGSDRKYLDEAGKYRWEIMQPPEKYLNHSCNPNTIRRGRSYFALQSIKKGEELTVEYRVNAHDGQRWHCYCGSKGCKKYLASDFFSMSPWEQRRYLPHTLPFIRQEYLKRRKPKHE